MTRHNLYSTRTAVHSTGGGGLSTSLLISLSLSVPPSPHVPPLSLSLSLFLRHPTFSVPPLYHARVALCALFDVRASENVQCMCANLAFLATPHSPPSLAAALAHTSLSLSLFVPAALRRTPGSYPTTSCQRSTCTAASASAPARGGACLRTCSPRYSCL